MASITKAEAWKAAGDGFGSIFTAMAQAPFLRAQAEQEAALKQAQIYAHNMHGNKYGAEAQDQMMTNQNRMGPVPEGFSPSQQRMIRAWQFIGGDPSKAADAMQTGLNTDMTTLAAANVGNVDLMNRYNTLAKPGTQYMPMQSVGNTGRVMHQATGSMTVADPKLAWLFGNKEQAQAQKDYAQAEKDRDSMRYGGNEVFQDGSGGVLLIDRRTGRAAPVTGQGGQPVIGPTKVGTDKALTEGQSKALLFGTRAQEADAIVAELGRSGVNTSIPGSRLPIVGDVVSAVQGPQHQRLDQAKRDFINAVLRRESGAVISDSEFSNAERQYFPQIGDSPQDIAQKARNREIAIKGMLAEVPNLQSYQAGIVGGAGGGAGAPGTGTGRQASPSAGQHLNMAREALRKGAPRAAVEAMLRQNGVDPSKL